jgi:hypothetical protein
MGVEFLKHPIETVEDQSLRRSLAGLRTAPGEIPKASQGLSARFLGWIPCARRHRNERRRSRSRRSSGVCMTNSSGNNAFGRIAGEERPRKQCSGHDAKGVICAVGRK